MSIEPTQEDIDLLMSPDEVMEIEGSKTNPIPSTSGSFDRKKSRRMLLDVHPDADITTIEACLSLSLLQQAKKVPAPNADTDVLKQINDLLSEDAAPPTQPDEVSGVTRMTEKFKFPRIVFTPEAQVKQDRQNSVWKRLDTPTDIHRRVVVFKDANWPMKFRDLRQQIEAKRKVT